MKVIKVQIVGKITTKAVITSGVDGGDNQCVTFHAHSDSMKARVLDYIAAGNRVHVSIHEGEAREGEWLEPEPS